MQTADGEEGWDSVGMCYVSSSNFETDIRNFVAEYDMKNNACQELKEKILNKAKTLSKYLTADSNSAENEE